jgi:phage baseplate assembly protein W
MAHYKGYSTAAFDVDGTLSLSGIELVKVDLLNHIFTRKGTRIGLPLFGTTIPDLVSEPLDRETIDLVRNELYTVFVYDPRVTPLKIYAVPSYETDSLVVECVLRYNELNLTDVLELDLQFG